ncbi:MULTISPECIES: sensor histidine kinase [unclassified Modestobacter]|uniref:sensor histidine kinase n=1 Tax=unclassified Modestobacter TaxID=2643866 RepID=UPI0022AAB249|nr:MULTISPECIES: histidine kinase [unclassified Modestobacter]MCZ2824514.1 histidine kinase [Modestobacter sp. VKM Ac-2981]MCZ2853958.1 histidine kinase [Modestobacter sp. VKM Ac-2982]
MAVTRPDDRAPARSWTAGTAIAGILLVLLQLPTTTGVYGLPFTAALLIHLPQGLALPLALRRPLLATAVQFVAAAATALAVDPVDGHAWPLTVPGVLLLVAHVGLLAVSRGWRPAALVWGASLLGLACLMAVQVDEWGSETAGDITVVVYAASALLVLMAGSVWQQRSRLAGELSAAQRDVAVEQARRALVEERTRIARELHDVVAHTMSVVHMQASTARFRLPDLGPEAAAELQQIAGSAKAAMAEMRQLLGVLRDDGANAPVTPTPTLPDLPELVAGTARGGTAARLTVDPALVTREVPEIVQAAAYRVVQEALSNVVRHAPGAPATVDVRLAPEGHAIELTVTNPPTASPVAQPGAGMDLRDPTRARHGLIGIRERATLLGGWSSAGPVPGGGWQVDAHLPLAAEVPVATDLPDRGVAAGPGAVS